MTQQGDEHINPFSTPEQPLPKDQVLNLITSFTINLQHVHYKQQ